MGNIASVQSDPSSNHTLSHDNAVSTSISSETSRTFSVSPLEPSTFVSITKRPSQGSSYESSPAFTGEYCTWNWEKDTSACSTWTYTVDITTPTPFATPISTPTPTGGYQSSDTSYTFPDYTCTNFACIDSVASEYGFSLCLSTSTSTPDWSYSTETYTPTSAESYTTRLSVPTITPTCNPLLDWKNCPGTHSEPWYSATDSWPIESLPTVPLQSYSRSSQTTSSCDSSSTTGSSSSTTEIDFTITASLEEPSETATTSKNTYSYHGGTDTKQSGAQTSKYCDLEEGDCVPLPAETGTLTTRDWDPISSGKHIVAATASL